MIEAGIPAPPTKKAVTKPTTTASKKPVDAPKKPAVDAPKKPIDAPKKPSTATW